MIKLLILQLILLVIYLLIGSDQSKLECNCRLGGIKKRIIGKLNSFILKEIFQILLLILLIY